MMEEIWKPIPEFENYLVSNKGRVKNNKTGNILKPFLKVSKERANYKRYRMVVRKAKRSYNFCIHRLVGELFVPNENNYSHLKFIDQNPLNVEATNLEWMSSKEFTTLWKSRLAEFDYQYYGNEGKPIRATHIHTGNVIDFDSITEAVKFFHTKYNFVSRVLKGIQKHHREHKFELIKLENEECVSLGKRKKIPVQKLKQPSQISMI